MSIDWKEFKKRFEFLVADVSPSDLERFVHVPWNCCWRMLELHQKLHIELDSAVRHTSTSVSTITLDIRQERSEEEDYYGRKRLKLR